MEGDNLKQWRHCLRNSSSPGPWKSNALSFSGMSTRPLRDQLATFSKVCLRLRGPTHPWERARELAGAGDGGTVVGGIRRVAMNESARAKASPGSLTAASAGSTSTTSATAGARPAAAREESTRAWVGPPRLRGEAWTAPSESAPCASRPNLHLHDAPRPSSPRTALSNLSDAAPARKRGEDNSRLAPRYRRPRAGDPRLPAARPPGRPAKASRAPAKASGGRRP